MKVFKNESRIYASFLLSNILILSKPNFLTLAERFICNVSTMVEKNFDARLFVLGVKLMSRTQLCSPSEMLTRDECIAAVLKLGNSEYSYGLDYYWNFPPGCFVTINYFFISSKACVPIKFLFSNRNFAYSGIWSIKLIFS